jgi:hypothetical protein
LEIISDSKKSHANLNRFNNCQRIQYQKKFITHGINNIPTGAKSNTDTSASPHHQQHLHLVTSKSPNGQNKVSHHHYVTTSTHLTTMDLHHQRGGGRPNSGKTPNRHHRSSAANSKNN